MKYLAEADGFADLWAGKCTIVPLVTCGECKHYHKSEMFSWCEKLSSHGRMWLVGLYDYCCWGERRER